jgi:SAM-dependent methyltransferase
MDIVLQPVADYYAGKVAAHGSTPQGVDWNSGEGQQLRFTKLLEILPPGSAPISLDDYGCGYGALFDHLQAAGRSSVDYLGIDIAAPMVSAARAGHPAEAARFHLGAGSPRRPDFAVASGIFNVRPGIPLRAWEEHIAATLDELHASATRGFAFNCLTSYSDADKRRDHLYYGDPCFYFDWCKRRYARNVALLHDYGLYEFTLLVRKDPSP